MSLSRRKFIALTIITAASVATGSLKLPENRVINNIKHTNSGAFFKRCAIAPLHDHA